MDNYKRYASDIQPGDRPGGKELRIAACGNDCFACPRYNVQPFAKTEEELRRTAELWTRIGYRDRMESPDEIACKGCRPENRCRYGISCCCGDKGIVTCAECGSFPCGRTEECLAITESFRQRCRDACTEEEYRLLQKAFFEKAENLETLRSGGPS